MLTNNNCRRLWKSFLIALAFVSLLGGLVSTPVRSAFWPNPMADADAAIKEADKAIGTARQATAKIEEAKIKLVEANKNQKAEESTWKAFVDLTKFLKGSIDKSLKDHKDGITALTAQKAALEKIRKELEALKEKPEGTDTQIANLKKKEAELEAQLKASNDATPELEKETKKLCTNAETIAKSISASLALLADDKLPPNAKADALFAALPVQLPVLAAAMANDKEIEKAWPPLAEELKKITAVSPDPALAFPQIKKDIGVPEAKLTKWLDTLMQQALKTNKSLVDKRLELDKDLQANAVTAMKLLDEAEEEQQSLADFVGAWEVLVPQINGSAGFANLKKQFEAIQQTFKGRPGHGTASM